MAIVDGVVGNSSSGILEAPALKIGVINIGDRQMGRIQAPSVINSKPEEAHLIKAIKKLFSEDFQIILESVKNPYGDGGASSRIINILRSDSLDLSVKKKFHDL